MNQQDIDLTKLFSIINSIVCALFECTDATNTVYMLSIGYLGNLLLLKLDTEDNLSVYRFELTTTRDAKEKMEWIVSEKRLSLKIATYFYDPSARITSDYYSNNVIQYTFDTTGSGRESIAFTYKLHSDSINPQEVQKHYDDFIAFLGHNDYGLPVTEQHPRLINYLRKEKLKNLGSDWLE